VSSDNQFLANERAALHLQRSLWNGIARSFRGSIADNCKRFKLVGDGYRSMPAEQDGHFCIESARHLNGPLLALLDGFVRFVHVIGATQVMKSLCGDIWAVYLLEHLCAAMLVLFEDDPKADLYCQHRAIETVKKHPVLARMIAVAMEENRFGTTGTRIKTPYSSLLVAGLNDGHTSSLSWQYLWISEAWQHPKDGLLFKAFKRADRFENTCKILNESQASIAGTDLHRAVKDVLQVPLVWRCPACNGEQSFEWRHWSFKRPDDFKPRPSLKIATVTIGGETALLETTPKPGTYAGMIIPDDDEGKRDVAQRARMAYWECLHCGHHINDTKAEREAIAETYTQDYRTVINGIKMPPKQVCFVLPFEANKDNRFEKTVASFLIAKHAKSQGNEIPLQDWFCAERSVFYEKGQTAGMELSPTIGSYDPNSLIADEHSRNMSVDVQKKIDAAADEDVPGSFWVLVEVVDKRGNSWDLARHFCTAWEEVVAIQKRWQIPNARVVIDGRKWTPDILQKAADYSELVDVTDPLLRKFQPWLKKYRQCWKILLGDDAAYFKWGTPNSNRTVLKPYSMPHSHEKFISVNGHTQAVRVYTTQWSNIAISDQLHELMTGGDGKPKIHTLDRSQLDDKTKAREVGDLTYERQINAEYRTERRGKAYWEKKRPDNHYLDCRKMLLVRKLMDNMLGNAIDGSAAVSTPETVQESEAS